MTERPSKRRDSRRIREESEPIIYLLEPRRLSPRSRIMVHGGTAAALRTLEKA